MLHTKLHRPLVTNEHVNRHHLIDSLDKNIYKPVTLVSAGAGYGKSMLISSWLERRDSPYAWGSLNLAYWLVNSIHALLINCCDRSYKNKMHKS